VIDAHHSVAMYEYCSNHHRECTEHYRGMDSNVLARFGITMCRCVTGIAEMWQETAPLELSLIGSLL